MSKPTDTDQLTIANRNVRLYVFIKVFAKRVFLPLSAIYFIDTFGFTLREIGLLAAFFALSPLIVELPTGYFADRFARVTCIRIGALLNVAATLLYVFSPDKTGIFVGQFLEAVGYSFLSGAGEALIHDSLEVRGDTKKYSKILSRAQSVSLLINAVLIALVPMTYRIDHRLPFLIGSIAYFSLFTFALFMSDVKRHKPARAKLKKPSFAALLRTRNIITFAVLFGIIGALYTAPNDFVNLALVEFGIKPELLGWVFAAASLFGAMFGLFTHHLRRLSFQNYMMVDCLVLLLMLGSAYTKSAVLLGSSVVVAIAFWRYRRIIYQDHMLGLYPTKYKATMLSAMNNVEQLNALWIPLFIAGAVTHFGLSMGLTSIGLFALLIAPLYVLSGVRLVRSKS